MSFKFKKRNTIGTKIKDKVVKFDNNCNQSNNSDCEMSSGVKDKIQLFEEKLPSYQRCSNSNKTLSDETTKEKSKIPELPPWILQNSTTNLQTPVLPTVPELGESSKIVLENSIASKPLWKGREYLKQLSTEDLIKNLRIIEELRNSYIKEINETSHDIAIYRQEKELNSYDEEFGLSELNDDEDSYIVEAYNTAGNELVISQLQFDHHNEIIESKADNWQHNNLRDSQYSEASSEDSSIYMSLKDCLSGAPFLYEDSTSQNAKSKNLKIKIDVTLNGDDDDDDDEDYGSRYEKFSQHKSQFVPTEKKDYLIEELINTEEKYISDLEKVVKHYIPYLQKVNLPVHLQGKQQILFGNIAEIYAESKDFLDALKTCGYEHEKIAKIFLRFKYLFHLYPLYSKNKPKADTYLPEFKPFARGKQDELGERLDLGSYLLTPIQRLGKYILFLKGINEQLNKKYSYSVIVQAALDMVKRAMSRANDYIAIDSIKNCPINLSKEAGSFVMREKFLVLRPNKIGQTFESTVFFFDEIIVFTIDCYKDKEMFEYIDSIKMTDLILVPSQSEPLLIKLENYSKSKRSPKGKDQYGYILEARSPRIKQFWTENIEKRLWEQMNKWKEEVKAQYSDGNVSPVVAQSSRTRSKIERAKTLPEGTTRRRDKKKSSTFYIKLN